MAANLTAIFRLVDEISAKLDRISNSGGNVAERLEAAGNAADGAFTRATNGGAQAARSVDGVAQSATSAASAMDDASSAAEEMGKSLDGANHSADTAADGVEDFGEKSEQAGKKGKQFGNATAEAVQKLQNVLVAAGIGRLLKEIYDGFASTVDASIEFESAITGVYKTVDGTTEQLASISNEVKDLATVIPASTTEIAGVAEAAGQLGIATEDVMDFTEVMINLGEATNLSADEAASSLAKFVNITKMSSSEYENLGSTIVALGNNFATTEADITAMAMRMASAGTLAGLSEPEILALAASLSSLGIEADAGGSSMSTMLTKMQVAVETGGEELEQFADVAGMTGEEFAELFGNKAVDALYAFISGLNDTGRTGKTATVMLDEMGITEIRLSNAIKSLAGNNELLSSAIDVANQGWSENTALTSEAEKRYGTLASKMAMMDNATNNLSTAFGDKLTPIISGFVEAGTGAVEWFTEVVEKYPAVSAVVTGLAVGIGVVGIALAGYTVATTVATAVTTAFGVASMAALWPLYLVAAAIGAVVAVAVLVANSVSEADAEFNSLTATSKNQYQELENLNKEYEDACATYGETSDEASKLRYEMDELNDSFEANKQTVEEFTAEVDALVEANGKLITSYQDSVKEIDNAETGTFALIYKLKELGSQTDLTVGQQEQMKAIIEKLNETVPDLALNYDDVTNSLDATVASLQAMAKQQAEQQRYEESYSTYVDLLAKEAELQDAVSKAEANLNAEREARGMYWDEQMQQWTNDWYTEDSPWASWTTDLDEYGDALEQAQAALDENRAAQEKCVDVMGEYAGATSDAAEETVSYEDAVTSALNSVQDEMDELVAAYDKAYAAAKESLDGTVGLFDKVETEAGLSSKAVIEAWQSQIDFFNQYSDNLEKLENLGVDPDLLKELSDGSAESIAQVQTLADELGKLDPTAAESAVNTINTKFGELTTAKETAATTMAEIQTDFTTKLDEIEKKLNDTIDGMNMETDAAEAAKKTMSAYTQAIKDNTSGAVTAAQAAARAVAAALKTGQTPSGTANSGGGSSHGKTQTGYASGTPSAERGYALVGEEGPEIVWFNGGETVFPTDDTDRIISSVTENNYYTTKATAVDNLRQTTKVPDALAAISGDGNTGGDGQEKKITLEIAGKGQLEISGGMDKDTVVELLYEYLKPVLTETLKQEIYEEGELSYVY